MYDRLERYWSTQGVGEKPNFEDALHVITQLGALPPEQSFKKFTPALGAFVNVCPFPEVGFGSNGHAVDSATWRKLAECLVYGLIAEFRVRCSSVTPDTSTALECFFDALASEFDVAVVTTNYDDLVHRASPTLETGFDNGDNGVFKQERILYRTTWPCLLHLHGSVHFDGMPDVGDHIVRWNNDLSGDFYQHAGSRSTRYSNAGYASPASPIIAGYAKAEKIGELTYRTYYSELARLVYESEALLVLGHSLGLGDTHLREAFVEYGDARCRNVVLIDYASAPLRETSTPARAMRVFCRKLLDSKPDVSNIEALKASNRFAKYTSGNSRLFIWYNGMREACNNVPKIVTKLKTKE
jgi:hypothetical protein